MRVFRHRAARTVARDDPSVLRLVASALDVKGPAVLAHACAHLSVVVPLVGAELLRSATGRLAAPRVHRGRARFGRCVGPFWTAGPQSHGPRPGRDARRPGGAGGGRRGGERPAVAGARPAPLGDSRPHDLARPRPRRAHRGGTARRAGPHRRRRGGVSPAGSRVGARQRRRSRLGRHRTASRVMPRARAIVAWEARATCSTKSVRACGFPAGPIVASAAAAQAVRSSPSRAGAAFSLRRALRIRSCAARQEMPRIFAISAMRRPRTSSAIASRWRAVRRDRSIRASSSRSTLAGASAASAWRGSGSLWRRRARSFSLLRTPKIHAGTGGRGSLFAAHRLRPRRRSR